MSTEGSKRTFGVYSCFSPFNFHRRCSRHFRHRLHYHRRLLHHRQSYHYHNRNRGCVFVSVIRPALLQNSTYPLTYFLSLCFIPVALTTRSCFIHHFTNVTSSYCISVKCKEILNVNYDSCIPSIFGIL